MKKYLAVALVAIMALGATACSSGSGSTSASNATSNATAENATNATEVKYADTFTVGENTEPKSMDPDESNGATEARHLCHVFEGLVREDSKGSIVPLLAESWTISEDGLTYTFKLKPDVKFSDGTAVTGADWIFSLERARDYPNSNSRTVASSIVKVEAPDDTTLVITLDKPVASFLANLCKWNMVVKSKAYHDKVGDEGFLTAPMGTGPYMVTEWKKGEYMKFDANPYYHEAGKPATPHMIYKFITDDNTRMLQLQAGEIDIMPFAPVNMMEQIAADSKLEAMTFPGTQIRFIVMNCTDPILGNQDVRTALNYATDKQAILDMVAGGYGNTVTSFVSETYPDLYNSGLTQRGPDIAKAKDLLAKAGYPNGIEITMSLYGGNSVYENIATILQSQWAEAGITLKLNSLESGTLIESLDALTYQITLLQWTDSTPDPSDIGAYECRYADSKQWYSGLENQELEDAYMATISEMDPTARAEKFHTVQQMVYDLSNIIPLFRADFTYGVSKNIQNLAVTPFNKINSADIVKIAQ